MKYAIRIFDRKNGNAHKQTNSVAKFVLSSNARTSAEYERICVSQNQFAQAFGGNHHLLFQTTKTNYIISISSATKEKLNTSDEK